MGDCHVCNGEYKCELSGANKRLVPDHIDRRVESGSSSATHFELDAVLLTAGLKDYCLYFCLRFVAADR